MPYTPYPIPHTLYSIPYTLYSIPYTLYPIPYTQLKNVHHRPLALNFKLQILNPEP